MELRGPAAAVWFCCHEKLGRGLGAREPGVPDWGGVEQVECDFNDVLGSVFKQFPRCFVDIFVNYEVFRAGTPFCPQKSR